MMVPKELWLMIVDYLGPFDALSLRATSHFFNTIVTSHQTYWYRQFAWFLVVQNKWRAAIFKTGCGRTHKVNIPKSPACLSLEQERLIVNIYRIKPEKVRPMIEQCPELMDGLECSNPLHFVYELPKSRFSIPIISADFHPTEQIYMYRFLIHNYRHRRAKVKRFAPVAVKVQKKQTEIEICKLETELEKMRKKLISLTLIHEELTLLDKNKVFFGSKSRQYPRH